MAVGQQALGLHPGVAGEARHPRGQRDHHLRAQGHGAGPAVRLLVSQQHHDQLQVRVPRYVNLQSFHIILNLVKCEKQ